MINELHETLVQECLEFLRANDTKSLDELQLLAVHSEGFTDAEFQEAVKQYINQKS